MMVCEPTLSPELGSRGQPLTLRLAGDLDLESLPALTGQLREVIRIPPPAVVIVDLSGVTFIDCSSLGPLVAARTQLGPRLRLQGASPPVVRLLEVTNLYDSLVGHPA